MQADFDAAYKTMTDQLRPWTIDFHVAQNDGSVHGTGSHDKTGRHCQAGEVAVDVMRTVVAGDGDHVSAAVRVDNLLYLSGQMGTDASLKIVPGGIEAETR